MLEVVSDLLWLIEAIQASKDNWNDAHWRLHVKTDKAAFDLEIGGQV